MTLVIAVTGKNTDGTPVIILGSDSRSVVQDSGGNRVDENNTKKIIHTGNLCVLIYGKHEMANTFLEYFQQHKSSQKIGKIATNFALYCKLRYEQFLSPHLRRNLPNVGFILAGFDKSRSKLIPQIYHIDSEDNFFPEKCDDCVMKGRPNIALYLFRKNHSPELPIDDLLELTSGVIDETIFVDGDVGGDIKLAVMSNNNKLDELPHDDVQAYIPSLTVCPLFLLEFRV